MPSAEQERWSGNKKSASTQFCGHRDGAYFATRDGVQSDRRLHDIVYHQQDRNRGRGLSHEKHRPSLMTMANVTIKAMIDSRFDNFAI